MKKPFITIFGIVVAFILSLGTLAFSQPETAIADNPVIRAEKNSPGWLVFKAVTDTENLWSSLESDQRVSDYVTIRKFRLCNDPRIMTFLVEGIKNPYVGARRQMWWIVLHDQNGGYRVICALGSADGVRIVRNVMHNGLRDIFLDFPPTNFEPASTLRHVYDGRNYVAVSR